MRPGAICFNEIGRGGKNLFRLPKIEPGHQRQPGREVVLFLLMEF